MTTSRTMKGCHSCGQVDDHPRHVVAYPGGEGVTPPDAANKMIQAAAKYEDPAVMETVLAEIADTGLIEKHLDCCAADGCPDEGVPGLKSCTDLLAAAGDVRGPKLVAALTADTGEDN